MACPSGRLHLAQVSPRASHAKLGRCCHTDPAKHHPASGIAKKGQ